MTEKPLSIKEKFIKECEEVVNAIGTLVKAVIPHSFDFSQKMKKIKKKESNKDSSE